MEVDNIGIPVILQDLNINCDDNQRNSISVIPQDIEPDGSEVSRNSISVIPQDIEPNGNEVKRNSIALIPQEILSNAADITCKSIPLISQEIEPNVDDTRRNSIPVIPQESEPNGDESDDIRRNIVPVIPGVAEPIVRESDDIIKKFIPEIPHVVELDGGASRKTSIVEIHHADMQIPVIPKETESSAENPEIPKDGHVRRNTLLVIPAGIEANGADIKRKSIGRKIESRYLRASLGSCHDFCKYGMGHGGGDQNLEKAASARRKNLTRVSSTLSPDSFAEEKRVISFTKKGNVSTRKVSSHCREVDVSMEDSVLMKVISAVSPELSLDSKAKKLNNSFATDKRILSLAKKGTASLKKGLSLFKKIDTMTDSMAKSAVNPKPSFSRQGSSNQEHSGTRKSQKIPEDSSSRAYRSIRNKSSRNGEKKTVGLQTVSLSSKDSVKRVSKMNIGSSKNLKGSSHLKDQKNTGKVAPAPSSDDDVPEKFLYVIGSTSENTTVEPTSNSVHVPILSSALSSVSSEGKHLKHGRKGISRTQPSSSEKITLKHVMNGAHTQSPNPQDPNSKGLRRTHGNRESLSRSSSISVSTSEFTHNRENGATSQDDTFETEKQIRNLKVDHKAMPRRSGIENKNNVPRKLTFRRGRVIEMQPEKDVTPRRLKFKRVRLAMESQISKGSIIRGSSRRKGVGDTHTTGAGTIKRERILEQDISDCQPNSVGVNMEIIGTKEVDDCQSNGAELNSDKVVLRNQEVEGSPRKILNLKKKRSVGVLNDIRSSPEKVVLRHRGVKGKTDEQKLYNNVIEETASKLAGTRKSKVKALVGAFETVISLQDRRPAVTADTH